MFQKCTSGHIEATQLDVVDIVRKIIHTGNTVVTKRKTAAKGESQFVVKQNIFDEFDDPLNDLLADTFIFDVDIIVDADVVGQFKNTEEVVGITVNNKVTTCDVDIEICCETSITEDEPITTPPPTTTTPNPGASDPTTPKPPPPVSPPKCGVRNEDGLVITAKNPSEKEAR